jgi:hypothetical protein
MDWPYFYSCRYWRVNTWNLCGGQGAVSHHGKRFNVWILHTNLISDVSILRGAALLIQGRTVICPLNITRKIGFAAPWKYSLMIKTVFSWTRNPNSFGRMSFQSWDRISVGVQGHFVEPPSCGSSCGSRGFREGGFSSSPAAGARYSNKISDDIYKVGGAAIFREPPAAWLSLIRYRTRRVHFPN